MKTSALFIAALAVVTISSCSLKDEYTCVCTNTATGSVISTTTIEALTASDAADACDERESLIVPDQCLIQ
jgi:hypothetical protein